MLAYQPTHHTCCLPLSAHPNTSVTKDHLRTQLRGVRLPAWFIRLTAPITSRVLTHTINLSVHSWVLTQWKKLEYGLYCPIPLC